MSKYSLESLDFIPGDFSEEEGEMENVAIDVTNDKAYKSAQLEIENRLFQKLETYQYLSQLENPFDLKIKSILLDVHILLLQGLEKTGSQSMFPESAVNAILEADAALATKYSDIHHFDLYRLIKSLIVRRASQKI